MSYNYDYDPWAESNVDGNQQAANSSAQPANSQQQQQQTQYSATNYSQQYSAGAASGGNSAYQQSYYASNQAQAYGDAWAASDAASATPTGDQQYYQPDGKSSQFISPQLAATSAGKNQIQEQQYNADSDLSEKQQQHQQSFLRRKVPAYNACMNCMDPAIDTLLKHVNRDLLVSKVFYFFFYSAFGSLFPLMGVYFKQLGMNPAQVGILTGVRPFIEMVSAPFWTCLAERFHKAKQVLLFSLLSWIIFTHALAHIRPPASACIAYNDKDYVLFTPYGGSDLSNYYEVDSVDSMVTTAATLAEAAADIRPPINALTTQSSVKEGKDRILAEEETQNDQRRRKRFAPANDGDNDEAATKSGDDDDAASDNEASEESTKDKDEDSSESSDDKDKDEGGEGGDEAAATKSTPDEEKSAEGEKERESPGKQQQQEQFQDQNQVANKTKKVYKQRHKTPPTHIVGKSPITVEYAVNYNKTKHSEFVTPMFSTIVYKVGDIQEVFYLLLLLICLGEFFSAPALTLADAATLGYLGEKTDLYVRQRMFGSLSWAVILLFVGMALDNSKRFSEHPCGPHERERSYTVCFAIFSFLMACAGLVASKFRFSYAAGGAVPDSNSSMNKSGTAKSLVTSTTNDFNSQQVVTTTLDSTAGSNQIDDLYASTQPRSIFNTAPPINAPPPNSNASGGQQKDAKFEYLEKMKSAVFAQRTREMPEWLNVFRQFNNRLHLLYLFITWFLGCGVGLVFTFLFWHLQDIGGTPTLFGICSVINHISEILAYFFSFHFIKTYGHTKVLSVGLGCNVIRFMYVAFLTNPYYALPFELVQGITHAACFAACCSYLSHAAKPELRASTQGVVQGLHHGMGRACGTLIGGYMINAIGSRASFCIYGLLSSCVLAGLLYVRKRVSNLVAADEDVKVDDSEALGGYGAPQGVPSAIPGAIVKNQNYD